MDLQISGDGGLDATRRIRALQVSARCHPAITATSMSRPTALARSRITTTSPSPGDPEQLFDVSPRGAAESTDSRPGPRRRCRGVIGDAGLARGGHPRRTQHEQRTRATTMNGPPDPAWTRDGLRALWPTGVVVCLLRRFVRTSPGLRRSDGDAAVAVPSRTCGAYAQWGPRDIGARESSVSATSKPVSTRFRSKIGTSVRPADLALATLVSSRSALPPETDFTAPTAPPFNRDREALCGVATLKSPGGYSLEAIDAFDARRRLMPVRLTRVLIGQQRMTTASKCAGRAARFRESSTPNIQFPLQNEQLNILAPFSHSPFFLTREPSWTEAYVANQSETRNVRPTARYVLHRPSSPRTSEDDWTPERILDANAAVRKNRRCV